MLPHRLISSVFISTDFTFDFVVLPMIEYVQPQRIFSAEIFAIKITDELFWLVNCVHMFCKVSLA